MKIIIMGCGRVGATLAEMMIIDHHDVTVIDASLSAFARLPAGFKGTKLQGDGTDDDILRRAGAEGADCFIAVTNGDNRNILAAQIAKHTFHVPRVICRIYDPIRQEVYRTLNLESICPTIVGAQLIREALLHPELSMASATLSIAEGRSVPAHPPLSSDVTPGEGRGGMTPNGTYKSGNGAGKR
jgi:trk system potassium uptake protein TrkA